MKKTRDDIFAKNLDTLMILQFQRRRGTLNVIDFAKVPKRILKIEGCCQKAGLHSFEDLMNKSHMGGWWRSLQTFYFLMNALLKMGSFWLFMHFVEENLSKRRIS